MAPGDMGAMAEAMGPLVALTIGIVLVLAWALRD